MTDDRILTLLHSQRESKALRALYSYQKPIIKYITSNQGNKHDAEDIFQEALALCCEKVVSQNFKPSSAINTYLYGVSKNLWRNQLRKKRPDYTDKTIDVEDEIIEQDHDLLKDAEKAISSLGKKCIELLQLFYFQPLKMDEIAKTLGFASGKSARNQKYKCLAKAKANLITQNA